MFGQASFSFIRLQLKTCEKKKAHQPLPHNSTLWLAKLNVRIAQKSYHKIFVTLSLSRFCPYSSITVVPLCITPFPVIIQVPYRRFVIVDGKSSSNGECVVTPISIDPAHLSTILSSLTSNVSLGRKCRLVKTTPLLKSSRALIKQTCW